MHELRIGHSPDPDDAFMWWPLADFTGPDGTHYQPRIDTHGYRFIHVLEDIQSLNERSEKGELEITAISIHQYPFVADRYALTSCGSSMGDGYGPMLVAREDLDPRDLVDPVATGTPRGGTGTGTGAKPRTGRRPKIAIPGQRTTAWLALQLFMLEQEGVQVQGDPDDPGGPNRSVEYHVVPFDRIIDVVVSGEYDAGLIIHEGQLTYADAGLRSIVDLGQWWKETRGLPLPLGGNAIRRDLGPDKMAEVCGVLLDSIRYALEHREEAVRFSLQWARGMGHDLADRFVGMYVNDWTLDYGETGREAVRRLLGEGCDAGIVPAVHREIEFVGPA